MTSRIQGKLLAQRALFQRLQSSKRLSKLGQAGFTLIELLVGIAIVGILSAIAIPTFLNTRDAAQQQANEASAVAAARSCATALLTGAATLPIAPTGPGGVAPVNSTCEDNTAITYGAGAVRGQAIPQDDGTVAIEPPP